MRLLYVRLLLSNICRCSTLPHSMFCFTSLKEVL
jgi:hypothetical protein